MEVELRSKRVFLLNTFIRIASTRTIPSILLVFLRFELSKLHFYLFSYISLREVFRQERNFDESNFFNSKLSGLSMLFPGSLIGMLNCKWNFPDAFFLTAKYHDKNTWTRISNWTRLFGGARSEGLESFENFEFSKIYWFQCPRLRFMSAPAYKDLRHFPMESDQFGFSPKFSIHLQFSLDSIGSLTARKKISLSDQSGNKIILTETRNFCRSHRFRVIIGAWFASFPI